MQKGGFTVKISIRIVLALVVLTMVFSCSKPVTEIDTDNEKKIISEVVENSIGWALTKDKDLLYSTLANDSSLFFFNPDDSFIDGFDQFQDLVDNFFMDDDFVATAFDVNNMRISISNSGDVAWWACILNDYGEYKGHDTSWINARWTGVLEKREGSWRIVQMHFSFPTP